ncbi:HAMP domain-containing protein, partial [Rhodovastum atsumiense]
MQMTLWIANLKIASRLMIGFGLLVLFLSGISGEWVYSTDASLQVLRDVIRLKDNEALNERAQGSLLEGRLGVWVALAGGDDRAWSNAENAFARTHQQLAELAQATTDPRRLEMVRELDAQVTTYATRAAELRRLGGRNEVLASSEGKAVAAGVIAAGNRVRALGEPLSQDYLRAAKQLASQSTDSLQGAIRLAMWLGLVSVLSGVGLAVIIARSITGPVSALTRTMRALADRDLSVAIPSLEQRDEVGEMARTVQVFKESMQTADRLAAEQEASRARRERRAAQIEALVRNFEQQAAELVGHLSSSATEMTATAGQMTQTARDCRKFRVRDDMMGRKENPSWPDARS